MADIAGLTLITPSSVAGSGVSLSGAKVVFSGATSVSVNGCFDSTYDNYLVVGQVTCSTNESIVYRMRASGIDNSTASSYISQALYANSSTVAGTRTTEDRGRVMGSFGTTTNGLHFYLHGPALAEPTATRSIAVSSNNSAYIIDYASTHNQSTAYDGFTFYTLSSGPTFTGSLTIYGFSE